MNNFVGFVAEELKHGAVFKHTNANESAVALMLTAAFRRTPSEEAWL